MATIAESDERFDGREADPRRETRLWQFVGDTEVSLSPGTLVIALLDVLPDVDEVPPRHLKLFLCKRQTTTSWPPS